LAQSYSDFEVIVVDDGSSDDTSTVVGDFGDARVRYLYQANAGRSTARNRGMAAAEGIYLAFLDDDDLYLPQKLLHQVLFLETNPDVDLVAAGTQLIDEHGAVQGVWCPWEDRPRLTLLDCLYGCPLIPSTVLFRRRMLDDLDHSFDPEVEPAEDTDFFIRLLHAGCGMDWLPEIVSAYRVHSTSSQWDSARYSRAHQKLLDKLFACPDLPADVLAERTRLYAHYHLTEACRAYACGQVASAQQDLLQALTLDPALQEGYLPSLVVDVANFANSFRVANPRTYIGYVFDQLPASLAHLRRYRNETFSAFHMERVFRAHAAGEHPSLRDWLLGVCHAPRWLGNRGVWSILAREILGLPFPTR
jgi:GT2 family glycosyltransferase